MVNPTKRPLERLLILGNPFLSPLDLYTFEGLPEVGARPIRIQHTGLDTPFKDREMAYREYVFKLDFPPGQQRSFYLKVQGKKNVSAHLSLLSPEEFQRKWRKETAFYGVYFGAIVMIVLYHLFLWMVIRGRRYLFFVAVTVFLSCFLLVNTGLGAVHFWPDNPGWSAHVLVYSIVGAIFFSLRFTHCTLEVTSVAPEMAPVIDLFSAAALLVLPLSYLIPSQLVVKTLSILALLASPLILGVGVLCWRRGFRPARFFVLAWAVLLSGVVLLSFRLLGLMPLLFSFGHFLMVGSLIEVVLLSLVLGDRVNLLVKGGVMAKQAGHTSEERFTHFMTHLPGLGTIKDLEGRVIFQSRFYRDKVGSRIGLKAREIFPGKMAKTIEVGDRKVMESGEPSSTLEEYPLAGHLRPFLVHRFLLPQKEGGALLAGLAFDMTELSETEKALQNVHASLEKRVMERSAELQATNEVLSNIINHLPHEIFWKDRNSTYQGCNQAFADYLSLPSPEMVRGKTYDDLPWPPEKIAMIKRSDKQILAGKLSILNSKEAVEVKGMMTDQLISKVPLRDGETNIIGILGIYIDITEQENLKRQETTRMEELVKKNQALHAKNEEMLRTQKQLLAQQKMAFLGTLTTDLAAEIRGPLSSAANLSELATEHFYRLGTLLKDAGEDCSELLANLAQNLRLIQKHADGASHIIQRVTEFSADGDGKPQETDINDLMEELSSSKLTGKSGVEIHKNFDTKLAPLVLAANLLGRVIISLVRNAYEAIEARDQSEEANYQPAIWLETRSGENEVEISIRDNGEGVPPGHKEKIFFPLFTTRPPGSGNIGMGLATSYEIVKQEHQGRLELRQEKDSTEFVIVLPRAVAS